MLEVHYNNPELKSGNTHAILISVKFTTPFYSAGFVDSSGIRFYVSDQLRDMDAGVIELGLEYTDKMAIPPKQESFSLTGYCISSCTSVVGTMSIRLYSDLLMEKIRRVYVPRELPYSARNCTLT